MCGLMAAKAQTFQVGDLVKSNTTVNVRSISNGIANTTALGQHVKGDSGVILAGPTTATLNGVGYTWYEVSWRSSPDTGWSIATALVAALPVKLISFSAQQNNKTVLLNWQTANELNTSHFVIQHGNNGTSFIEIGTVNAEGSGASGYSFTDNNPANGINYYRLESVDKDGATSYSKVVSCQ